MANAKYTWVKIHKEIVKYIIENESNRNYLLFNLLKELDIPITKQDGISRNIIDPFSFFRILYKVKTNKNRLNNINKIAKKLNIEFASDTYGVPSVSGLPFGKNENDYIRLWKLFFLIDNNSIKDEHIDKIVYRRKIKISQMTKITFTQCLFCLFPEKYLPIDSQTEPYLTNNLNLNLINDSFHDYKKLLAAVISKIDKPFYQISHEAWAWNENKNLKKTFTDEQRAIFEKIAIQKNLRFNKNPKYYFQIFPRYVPKNEGTKGIHYEFWNKTGDEEFELVIHVENKALNYLELRETIFGSDKRTVVSYKINSNSEIKEVFEKAYNEWEDKINAWYQLNDKSISEPQTQFNHIEKCSLSTPSNFILYGPPGTGKTYKTVDISASIIGNINEDITIIDDIIDYKKNEEEFHKNNTEIFNAGLGEKDNDILNIKGNTVHFVTFHQNYSYEEFVGGLRPDEDKEDKLRFKWKPGIFIKACAKAMELARKDNFIYKDEKDRVKWFFEQCEKYDETIFKYATNEENKNIEKVVLIIDEINRANISRVFGELITLIEDDKRIGGEHQLILTLPNGDKKFGVPANLIIMGTMNTADKSLALLDVALRRRFEFIGLFPKPELAGDHEYLLRKLNKKILDVRKSPNLLIGHSYFMDKKEEDLDTIFNNKVIPLLNEYLMGDSEKVKKLLEDSGIACKELEVTNYVVKYDDLKSVTTTNSKEGQKSEENKSVSE